MTGLRFLAISGLLLLANLLAVAAEPNFLIDESKIRIDIADIARLTLPVTSRATQAVASHIDLEFLDTKDKVVYSAGQDVTVVPGSASFPIPLPEFLKLPGAGLANYDWLRMKYSFVGDATGIVSVSRIASEPFVLKVLTLRDATSDSRYRIQVVTLDPTGRNAVGGVAISGTLVFDVAQNPRTLRSTARTNASGYAILDFDLPRLPPDSDADLEVTARLGNFVRTAQDSISLSEELQIVLNSDKPIYQPGQKLRVRMLAFDNQRKALDKTVLHVTISDSGSSEVFQTHVTTAGYGEAHIDWEIPDNARLGEYDIEVTPTGSYRSTHHSVKVDRYELPNFTVDVHRDHPYYLSRQSPEIEVRADYLFGQPVKNASVRVVREIERHWDFRENRWVTEDGATQEGVTDANGRLLVRLDLQKEDAAFADEERSNYEDLRYAVYVTDSTTNRTEQRRFDIRITKYPIHIYLVGNSQQVQGLPLEFFVSASYADGTPAECIIDILETSNSGRFLGSVKTNKYGVARVAGLTPSLQWREDADHASLEFRARDSEGRTGRQKEFFYAPETGVRVHTDKSLYRASEPISVAIESTYSAGPVILNAVHDGQIVYSRILGLTNGKAAAVIPASTAFKGDVLVSAFHTGDLNHSETYGIRWVSFPGDRDLRLEAQPDKLRYGPGEQAAIRFRIRDANGSPQQGLLGVTIIDKAVSERARTDAEFGRDYSFCPYCAQFLRQNVDLAGLTQKDFDRIDRRHIPADIELAEEVVLAARSGWQYRPELIDGNDLPVYEFRGRFEGSKPDMSRLATVHTMPTDEASLRALLVDAVPNFASLRDPWGNSYRPEAAVSLYQNSIAMKSAGPDETFNTSDDFRMEILSWNYFTQYGRWVTVAIQNHHQKTGGYVRDLATLKTELLKSGHDFDSWRDPWGRPYRAEFGIQETRYMVTIVTGGPSGELHYSVWRDGVDYTGELQARIDTVLNRFRIEQHVFPETEAQLKAAFLFGNISNADLTDVWGHLYYPVFKTQYGYIDRITFRSGPETAREIAPVTREVQIIRLASAGPDGAEGTADDFTALSFLSPSTEQAAEDANPAVGESVILGETNGALRGLVIDASGALIPGVSAKITRPDLSDIDVMTDMEGGFLVRNLEPGNYRIQLSLPGFRTRVVTNLSVRAGVVTTLVSTLEVSSVSTNVEVGASASLPFTTSSASVGSVALQNSKVNSASSALLSTPRLREYFPETLLWQPSLETGPEGDGLIRFKLADSVTTWKVMAIASTKDGRIGLVEKEILSAQPFFLEHNPPKTLTQGDEIALPIVVRSYLTRNQSLELSLKPENWFTSLDNPLRNIQIQAGEERREVFTFKAVNTVKDGKQRVTGIGARASDAIEKTSSVHPNGREIQQTFNQIFRGSSIQTVLVPPETIPGSVRAEFKIYPNLMSHVVDGIEGIMKRPYGCAEQTISSAYPSLLLLRYSKQVGEKPDAMAQKALRYLQIAYTRLLDYQTPDGGFSYWTHGEADPAVTAYAIQFLNQAKDFLPVSDAAVHRAYDWLAQHQSIDGSWNSDLQLTGHIAEVLSAPGVRQKQKDPLPHALEFLRKRIEVSNEPYAVASFALAAGNAGDMESAGVALRRLEQMTHRAGDAAYWDLQTNTPFYGWGLPGRLETTALAVKALALGGAATAALADQGLSFLLRNKDQFGVWYSTQATVRTLDALVTLVGSRQPEGEGSAEIFVNGARVASLAFGDKQHSTNPVTLDLSRFFATGTNRVEVRERKQSPAATVQIVESHYVPWNPRSQPEPGALRLAVRFDKTEAGINETITTRVSAERVGFRGYGMLLAEIGIPPGAEVDRASLEAAVAKAGWDLQRYDVLPDRIVAYLWPRAGGTQFEFTFRPRYAIRALAPVSTIYDYYNPEERAVVQPTAFVVR